MTFSAKEWNKLFDFCFEHFSAGRWIRGRADAPALDLAGLELLLRAVGLGQMGLHASPQAAEAVARGGGYLSRLDTLALLPPAPESVAAAKPEMKDILLFIKVFAALEKDGIVSAPALSGLLTDTTIAGVTEPTGERGRPLLLAEAQYALRSFESLTLLDYLRLLNVI